MTTTTIRVDIETHRALLAIAAQRNETLMDTVRAAAEALRRQQFAGRVGQELTALRSDPTAWASYLADAEGTSVRDGIA